MYVFAARCTIFGDQGVTKSGRRADWVREIPNLWFAAAIARN
jgi:hypothetical protein